MAVQADPRNDVFDQTSLVKERNSLEKYLDYLKEKETEYYTEQEEVRFIQSGIETLVQKIYDLFIKKSTNRVGCKNNGNVLKVGSFYEGTKNKFPNEFDFIFVLSELDTDEDSMIKYKHGYLLNRDEMSLEKYFYTKNFSKPLTSLKYSENATRRIYFKRIVGSQGPATKLMFIYRKHKSEDTCLHVDFVPAFKITDAKLGVSVNRICSLGPFRKEIVDTGSYLMVHTYKYMPFRPVESFTETEVHFIKHTLSLKHVTVYKLLKFLIGGHGHADKLREKMKGEGFSSHMIKAAMIRHHYECRNTDSEEKGPCIITVLENLLCYKREEFYPMLTFTYYSNKHGKSEKLLERRIEHFRKMQNSTNRLNLIYRKSELKPVGKQRLVMYKRETFCARYFERYWKRILYVGFTVAISVAIVVSIVFIYILTLGR